VSCGALNAHVEVRISIPAFGSLGVNAWE
jgi:hypothetical protein